METSSPTGGGLREELRSDAATLTGSAKQRIHNEVDARRSGAATQVKSLSSALDAAAGELSDGSGWLRSAFQSGARTLQQFADTVEHKDSRQLTREVEQLARDHPGAFLTACAAAGFAAARVMKAGMDEGPDASSPSGSIERYDPYQDPRAASGSRTVFAGMSDQEANAQPAYAGEM